MIWGRLSVTVSNRVGTFVRNFSGDFAFGFDFFLRTKTAQKIKAKTLAQPRISGIIWTNKKTIRSLPSGNFLNFLKFSSLVYLFLSLQTLKVRGLKYKMLFCDRSLHIIFKFYKLYDILYDIDSKKGIPQAVAPRPTDLNKDFFILDMLSSLERTITSGKLPHMVV